MAAVCMAEGRSRGQLSPGVRTALQAGLTCICCYLGSALDAALVYPQIDTAILFPSYAILTAALLFSPVRHWWIYLLASALGNYLPHSQGAPPSWVVMTEAANFIRAMLAAGGMRYLNPVAARFDTLRGVAAFLLFAVVIAPFVAAFVGAGVVQLHRGTGDFWLTWQAWFLSNALTGLTLLPIIVIVLGKAIARAGRPSWHRFLEASLMLIGLLTAGTLVFVGPYAGPSSLPARLYAPLPFLLWAAARFGPGGTCASLLVITILSIWGAVHEYGPFITQAPADNLLSLQLFLLAMSLPLLALAALMTERQQEITERKQREAALRASYEQNRQLAGRLITAQETERARIARQLHDDINQQLATLSIALSSLKRRLPAAASDAHGELARLQQHTINLSEEIRNLSHELHPGVLQHAGLGAALKATCAEFGLQHRIEVNCQTEGNLESVPAEVALCLYRVTQEALHNIAAHAGARHARVRLARVGAMLELAIGDDGQGFDQAEANRGGGLGLLSIDERVRLVRGSLRIDSTPPWGTELGVRVPLQVAGTEVPAWQSWTMGQEIGRAEPVLSRAVNL